MNVPCTNLLRSVRQATDLTWILGRRLFLGIEEALQVPDSRRVTQFAQSFGFNLADPLAGHIIHLADLLQRPLVPVNQAEAHFEDFSLAFGQAGQHVAQFFLEQGYVVSLLTGQSPRAAASQRYAPPTTFLHKRRQFAHCHHRA